MFTKEDPLKILSEMNNLTTQILPVSDNKIFTDSHELQKSDLNNWPSSDTIIVPEGYVSTPDISTNDITSLPI